MYGFIIDGLLRNYGFPVIWPGFDAIVLWIGARLGFVHFLVMLVIMENSFNFYVILRQMYTLRTTSKIPFDLRRYISQDTFNDARGYSFDKLRVELNRIFFSSILLTSLEMLFGFLPYMWSISKRLTAYYGGDPSNEYVVSCVFYLLITLAAYPKELPFSVYSTFWVEARHGFNKQTVPFFIKDQLKSFALSMVLTTPIVVAVIWIVQASGAYFSVWLWLFVMILSLVFLTVYPAFIAPLFDKYSPLGEGKLRTDIERLASRLRFPLKQLYVVNGSKRSAHSNAYFYGLWNSKRIVLFDTLLAGYVSPDADGADRADAEERRQKNVGCEDSEVVAVLAHELGHWKKNHIFKNIAVIQTHMLILFVAFQWLHSKHEVYTMFGFAQGDRPVLLGLIIICNYILSTYNSVISFGSTVLSRRFEYEADAFAVHLGYGEMLGSALIKLNADNLGFPVYDWLYSMMNHSHPTLLARLERITEMMPPIYKPELAEKQAAMDRQFAGSGAVRRTAAGGGGERFVD